MAERDDSFELYDLRVEAWRPSARWCAVIEPVTGSRCGGEDLSLPSCAPVQH
jgi:hypothetical protein